MARTSGRGYLTHDQSQSLMTNCY